MVDTRFHPSTGPIALQSLLASLALAPLVEDRRLSQVTILGADELETADATEIALAAQSGYQAALRDTAAGVVIVHPSLREHVPPSAIPIVHERAHELFVDILDRLYPSGSKDAAALPLEEDELPPFLEEGVRLAPNVVVGSGVEIGRNTVVGANTVIGRGVTIGRNAVIGANVTIEYAHLGNNVVVHPGARIGSEGFGWLSQGRTNRKIPQLGRVILQDSVEIGANTTVDRGALGDTVVGEGTKIDNLVQIGHNCRIGRYCLIAAHCGLSGSTVLEDSVLMGGRASTVGHLTVGAGTMIMGAGVATKDIPAGSRVGGYPAQDVRKWWQEVAALRRLAKGDKSGRES